jgi:hypothetical protein
VSPANPNEAQHSSSVTEQTASETSVASDLTIEDMQRPTEMHSLEFEVKVFGWPCWKQGAAQRQTELALTLSPVFAVQPVSQTCRQHTSQQPSTRQLELTYYLKSTGVMEMSWPGVQATVSHLLHCLA